MRRRGRVGPKLDPPEPQEPRCMQCGDYEVTDGSRENGTPLCEDHDSEIARKCQDAERAFQRAGEDMGHISNKLMDRSLSDQKLTRLRKRKKKLGSRRKRAIQRLEELQEECDHENLRSRQEVYTEEDFDHETAERMPGDLPVVETYKKCPECGWDELTREPKDE